MTRAERMRLRERAAAIALATLVSVCGNATRARAHVVSVRELRVVAVMPADTAARWLAPCVPDTAGRVAPSRPDHAIDLGRQRRAALPLIVAAARADTAAAERAWRALEVGFDAMSGTDSLGMWTKAATSDPDAVLDQTAWAGSACRGFIAVMNSGLQDRFRRRYAALKPQLQAAMDSLEARSGTLLATHAGRGGALLAIAAAFTLADGTFHDERYARVGQAALAEALALQRPDGAFPSGGRLDPREHALGIEALQSVVIYFPTPDLERAARRGVAWLRAHPPSKWPDARSAGRKRVAGSAAIAAVDPGEVEFVLRYATITPPPPDAAPPVVPARGFGGH